MPNKILNLIRVALVCSLILIGTIAGTPDHAEEPTATHTKPAETTEKETPTETTPQ